MSWGDGWGAEAWGGGFASDMGGLQGGNTGGTDRHGDQLGGGRNQQGGTPSGWTAGGPEAGSWVGKSRPDTQPGIGAAPTADITGANTSITGSSGSSKLKGGAGKDTIDTTTFSYATAPVGTKDRPDTKGIGAAPSKDDGAGKFTTKERQDVLTKIQKNVKMKDKINQEMENKNYDEAKRTEDAAKIASLQREIEGLNQSLDPNDPDRLSDKGLEGFVSTALLMSPLTPVTAVLGLANLAFNPEQATDVIGRVTGTKETIDSITSKIGNTIMGDGKTNTTKGASSNNNDSISGESGGKLYGGADSDSVGTETAANTSTSAANTNTGGWQGGSEGIGEPPTSITQTPASSQFARTTTAQSNNVDLAVLNPEEVKDELTVGTNRNTVRAFGNMYA